MAKNLGQICEAAAEQIERMFGNSELDIVRYINSAQKELALDTNKRTSGTVSVSNGTGSLPSDCLFVDKVFLNGNEIKPNESDSKDMNQNVSGTRWFVDDDDLKIIPSTSGDYEISYIATPEELVDDEDATVFNGADEYFIAYAVWKASSDIEGATNRTAYLFQELERERGLWKKFDDKKVDRPHFVKIRPWV